MHANASLSIEALASEFRDTDFVASSGKYFAVLSIGGRQDFRRIRGAVDEVLAGGRVLLRQALWTLVHVQFEFCAGRPSEGCSPGNLGALGSRVYAAT